MNIHPKKYRQHARSSTPRTEDFITQLNLRSSRKSLKQKKNTLNKNSDKFKVTETKPKFKRNVLTKNDINKVPSKYSTVIKPCQVLLKQCDIGSLRFQSQEENQSINEVPSKNSTVIKPCQILLKQCDIGSLRFQNQEENQSIKEYQSDQISSNNHQSESYPKCSTSESKMNKLDEGLHFITSRSVFINEETGMPLMTSTPVKTCKQNIQPCGYKENNLKKSLLQNIPVDSLMPIRTRNLETLRNNKNRNTPSVKLNSNKSRKPLKDTGIEQNKKVKEHETNSCISIGFTTKKSITSKKRSKSLSDKTSGPVELCSKRKIPQEQINTVENEKSKETEVQSSIVKRKPGRPRKKASSHIERGVKSSEKKLYIKPNTKGSLSSKFKRSEGNATLDDIAVSIRNKKCKAKSDGYKMPGKNTLKRKRFLSEKMSHADENYEDDIYESQDFDYVKNILKDTSYEFNVSCTSKELNASSVMSTPKLGIHVTPMVQKKTPIFKDIFSPREYARDRKIAEEVQYRRINRNKILNTSYNPEKKKLEFSEVVKNALQKEEEIQKMMNESSKMDDSNFSDS